MGLNESKGAILMLYSDFRNAKGVTNDQVAATLTLAAILHDKNATVVVNNSAESIGGSVQNGTPKF